MAVPKNYIASVADYINSVKRDTSNWDFSKEKSAGPWFRGQDRADGPIPKLYREGGYDEFGLTRMFRERAGAFGSSPETDRLDKWLFLMQHYDAATRLLDWTESPLIALYFALKAYLQLPSSDRPLKTPTVWALNPLYLNKLSNIEGFPNTWSPYNETTEVDGIVKVKNTNPGVEYFRLAYHPKAQWADAINLNIVRNPIAIQTTYYDLRMFSQRSCFTIHGTDENNLENIVASYDDYTIMYKYSIISEQSAMMLQDLVRLGINQATVFPDIAGLSDELSMRFKK